MDTQDLTVAAWLTFVIEIQHIWKLGHQEHMPGRLVLLPLCRGETDLVVLSFLQPGISPDAHQGFGQL